jgi:hypothetical protein
MDLIAAFRLFVRTLPIHFALLGRKRKYIKSKTAAKLKQKRKSIAVVRDILRMFDTFPNPLLSPCRRPLIENHTNSLIFEGQIQNTAHPPPSPNIVLA